ncbi:hypothetical protein [Vannielia litorea]|uniref:hypothetical protein n=1 Tax=Vannielia litorea TaxID=1217970 RepID=UPI001BCC8D87|nr:hypothetical protein [Vannielia litorea]MBS8227392.1 hypothetical protein [Vannielia litorea]
MAPNPTPLRIGAFATLGFGALLTLSTLPSLSGPLAWLIDLVIWPLDGPDGTTAPAARLLTAITGGLAIGWGVLVLGLSGTAFAAAPEAVRRVVIHGYLAWFAADCLGSVIVGAALNVIGNAAFLAVLLVPLMRAPSESPA